MLAAGLVYTEDVELPFSKVMKIQRRVEHFNSNLKDFASDKRGNILEIKGEERAHRFRFADSGMQPYVLMKGIGRDAAMKRVAIAAAAVLIFGAILAFKLTADKPDSKFGAHFRDAWSTCKGLYPEAKGKDFDSCVNGLVASYGLFSDRK